MFVGDLIDRGPKSLEVVEFVRQNSFDCIKGNHEDMMVGNGAKALAMIQSGRQPSDVWTVNGGDKTLNNYQDSKGNFDHTLFQEHVDWMANLPLFLEYPDIKNSEGRHLVVSHSLCHNQMDTYKKALFENNLQIQRIMATQVIWGRSFHKIKDVGFYNVVGHTVYEDNPRIRKIYANIDTGCFLGMSSWQEHKRGATGYLTALQYPEMITYKQECIDQPPKYQSIFGEIDD